VSVECSFRIISVPLQILPRFRKLNVPTTWRLRTMKRISNYFTKPTWKLRLTEDVSSNSNDSTIDLSVRFPNATSEAESSNSISAVNQNFWPSCWIVEQKSEFGGKNDWLFFHDGKLCCSVCTNCGYLSVEKSAGMRLSKEWIKCEIASYGDNSFPYVCPFPSCEFRHLFFQK
jgi:hypothetical protein